MSRSAFVYGYPIAHSISPPIHNAAFQARGLDVVYAAREVAPERVAEAVADLKAEHVLGANVTVPLKEAVLGLADARDEAADVIGAANTLYKRAGLLRATNTDAEGFARSLEAAGIGARGAAALLLGAGGSARAVAFALLGHGVGDLLVANRTLERAERLAAELRDRFPWASVRAAALVDLGRQEVVDRGLIVNTTTVGMHTHDSPLAAELLPPRGAVVDIIYNPARTRLLREAESAGLRTLNGLPMLVFQAAAAWEIWTGQEAPVGVMFEAAERALVEREQARTIP
jgi:shikimate dehydrogenase